MGTNAPMPWPVNLKLAGITFFLFLNPFQAVAQTPEWKIHPSDEWGFQLSYPSHWTVVIAREDLPGAGLERETLSGDEIYKVTFLEPGNETWPGHYQVRLLLNSSGADLDTVLSRFDLSDLWEAQPADTLISDLPAKTWVRWRVDSLTREFLAVLPGGILHLRFDESSPNDPLLEEHKEIYQAMTGSFSLRRGGGHPRVCARDAHP